MFIIQYLNKITVHNGPGSSNISSSSHLDRSRTVQLRSTNNIGNKSMEDRRWDALVSLFTLSDCCQCNSFLYAMV